MSCSGMVKDRSNPIRRPDIVARIKSAIANKEPCGNGDLSRLLLSEFSIVVTPGQIAGGLHREGIFRGTGQGGRPVVCPEGTIEERRVARLNRAYDLLKGRKYRYDAKAKEASIAMTSSLPLPTVPVTPEPIAIVHDPIVIVPPPEEISINANNISVLALKTPPKEIGPVEPSHPALAPSQTHVAMHRLSAASRSGNYASPFDNLAARPVRRESAPERYAPVRECCWPIGDVGTPDFRYCDEPHKNRVYCDAHVRIAYHKVRPAHAEMAQGAAD